MMLEIDGGKYPLAGFFDYGPNFTNDGTVITSEATMLLRLKGARDKVDWILVRLAPGADVEEVRARLVATLPRTLSVLTPEEMRMREVAYTTRKAPIGIVFGIGLVLGFIIGTSICYQILFNEINDHLPQFATLKAMGFGDGFLRRVVLTEAALLGAAGFVPGLAGSWLLYRVIERMTGIVMSLGPGYAAIVFALTVAMCVLAGLIAVRRVLKSDSAALL
jgi:putative ABC transport system permease protein